MFSSEVNFFSVIDWWPNRPRFNFFSASNLLALINQNQNFPVCHREKKMELSSSFFAFALLPLGTFEFGNN
jgi:hypothetical protein